MATIETIPLIMVFVFLIAYEFGSFGIIHTGIMQSISARTYTFETFKNRSSLVYFRDNTPEGTHSFYRNAGTRTHGIASELRSDADNNDDGIAAERPIRVGIPFSPDQGSRKDLDRHNVALFEKIVASKRNQKVEVNPVWIQVQYGMCLNVNCGGDN